MENKLEKYLIEAKDNKGFNKRNIDRLSKISDILQDIEDDFDSNASDEWNSADVHIVIRDLTDIYNTVVKVRKVFKAKGE